jgi:hypothetical protein
VSTNNETKIKNPGDLEKSIPGIRVTPASLEGFDAKINFQLAAQI